MGRLFEEPLILFDAGDGEMIYKNNRCYPVNRAYLERIAKAINNTILFFDNEGLDDISLEKLELEEREKMLNEERERHKNEKQQKKEKPKDHLYLIINNESNCLKIGRSKNPKARLKQLQIASHEKLTLLFIIPFFGDYEKDVHLEFESLRLNSEWFNFDNSIINKFKRLSVD